MMSTWKIGQPALLTEGQSIKFDHDGSIWQGQVISVGGTVKVVDAPVKRMINKVVTIKIGQVVAWQPARKVAVQ